MTPGWLGLEWGPFAHTDPYPVIGSAHLRTAFLACSFALVLGGLAAMPALAAQSKEQAMARLKAVQNQIAEVQGKLEAAQGRVGKLEGQLRRTERQIGATVRELREIDRELNRLQTHLSKLRAQRADQLREIDRQRAALGDQVRAAYMVGGQPQLKLWLNQDDPAGVGRLLVYYDYLNRARAERIEEVEHSIADLRRTERDIAEQTVALQDARSEQEKRHAELLRSKSEREQVIVALRKEIARGGKTLAGLKADEQQLQDLIESLSRVLADIPPAAGGQQPFAQLKGRLAWPINGALKARFGEPRSGSERPWRGVLIAAGEGQPVRAVSHGRVAFADWMRGFGLLVIIDHGDGYMSLYGQNQGLYKSVGDWVEANEVIASSGASGGGDDPGLYFEIRYKGKPQDPSAWCGNRVKVADTSAAKTRP